MHTKPQKLPLTCWSELKAVQQNSVQANMQCMCEQRWPLVALHHKADVR